MHSLSNREACERRKAPALSTAKTTELLHINRSAKAVTAARSLHTEAQEPLNAPETQGSGTQEIGEASEVWIRRAAPDDAAGVAALCSEVHFQFDWDKRHKVCTHCGFDRP